MRSAILIPAVDGLPLRVSRLIDAEPRQRPSQASPDVGSGHPEAAQKLVRGRRGGKIASARRVIAAFGTPPRP